MVALSPHATAHPALSTAHHGHVRLGLILPPFEQEKHSTPLLPCPVHRHSPSPSSCPAHPHLKLRPRCSSMPNIAANCSRSVMPQATRTTPRVPQSHPRVVVPVTSHQREVDIVQPGCEGTTPLTTHLQPPSTTGDATPSTVVAPCCSTDPDPAAPTTVSRHRHRSPPPELPAPWTDLPVSFPTPYCPKSCSPLRHVALATVPDPPHHRQPSKSAGVAAPTRWGQPSLFLWPRAKRPGGPETLARPA
jgi:hypothetical protein